MLSENVDTGKNWNKPVSRNQWQNYSLA